MSIRSDISPLSGISGISTLSCTSSTYQPPSSHHDQQLDKVLNAISKCDESICQIAHYKLIHECLEKIIDEDSHLPPEVSSKMKKILVAHNIKKYLKIPVTSNYNQVEDQLTLLGIREVPEPELNSEEKRVIKTAVETELMKKINSFIAKYEEVGGNLLEAMRNNESAAKQELLKLNEPNLSHWKSKLDELCNEYHRDILICADLLNEWQRLKNEDLEELNLKKAQSTLLQVEIAELQARLTKLTCAIKMFKETPVTVNAFKILDEQLDEKISEVESEIKKKTNLLKQYKDLQGTEYDEILKRYLDLCITIEKDERLLNSF